MWRLFIWQDRILCCFGCSSWWGRGLRMYLCLRMFLCVKLSMTWLLYLTICCWSILWRKYSWKGVERSAYVSVSFKCDVVYAEFIDRSWRSYDHSDENCCRTYAIFVAVEVLGDELNTLLIAASESERRSSAEDNIEGMAEQLADHGRGCWVM